MLAQDAFPELDLDLIATLTAPDVDELTHSFQVKDNVVRLRACSALRHQQNCLLVGVTVGDARRRLFNLHRERYHCRHCNCGEVRVTVVRARGVDAVLVRDGDVHQSAHLSSELVPLRAL